MRLPYSHNSKPKYYLHGKPVIGLQGLGESYRFSFNGQERDDEVAGVGNINTAEFWEYDTRTGKRWNTDPVVDQSESPYATNKNNPIKNNDPYGDCATCPPPSINAGLKFTGLFSGINKSIGVTGSVFATVPGKNVSFEFGANITKTGFSKMLGNTTGGGTFTNIQTFGMVGHGDNSNLLGSNSTGGGVSFFNPSGGGGFVGAGYAINYNNFTGGLSELSNQTGGLLLRGSFGSNNVGFSMFNDFAGFPHYGGGTDQGLTGTGDITYTRGLGNNESFSAGIFFKDITAVPDQAGPHLFSGQRYNPNNSEGVYNTLGLNKNLNFGMFGVKASYTKSMLNGGISIFRYGGAQGALFQDAIHNKMKPQTALFPYNMNDSKTGVELGF